MSGTGRRLGVVVVGAGLALGVLSGAASAHVIVVTPPGAEAPVHVGWAGGGELPGHGHGLVPGGPTGSYLQAPAHEGGLVTACESLRASGAAAVDIFGPPTPAGCAHGT